MQEQGYSYQVGSGKKTPAHKIAPNAHGIEYIEYRTQRQGQQVYFAFPHDQRQAGGEGAEGQRIKLEGVERVVDSQQDAFPIGRTCTEFGIGGIGEGEAVVDYRKAFPEYKRGKAQYQRAQCARGPLRPPHRQKRRQVEQERIHAIEGCQAGEEGEWQEGLRPSEIAPYKEGEYQVGQRVFQAGCRIVDKGLRSDEKKAAEEGRASIGSNAGQDQINRQHRRQPTDEYGRVIDLAAEGVGCTYREEPEGIGKSLDAFAGVPGQTVAVDEVIGRAVGDEGIVAEPGVLQDD